MKNIQFSLLLSLLIVICHTRANQINQRSQLQIQQIIRKEQQSIQILNINIENTQTYHFQLRKPVNQIYGFQKSQPNTREADFIINGIEGQDIKMIVNVFWKIDRAYTIPQVKRSQQVKLTVYQNKKNVVTQRTFYTTEGIQIHTRNSTQYFIRLSQNGIKQKLVQLTVQRIIPQVTIQKSDFDRFKWIQSKSARMMNSFNLLLRIVQRNRIFNEGTSNKILTLSKSYMGYQILEALFLIGIAIYQVKLIRKLTINNSII